MNLLTINSNKKLILSDKDRWYVGENDFEQIVVVMPAEISGNDMSEWLSDIHLYVLKDSFKWIRDLTFTLNSDGDYESEPVSVESTWCQSESSVGLMVRFDNDSELGKTNTVYIDVLPSDNTEILNGAYATEDYVNDAVEGLASEEYVDDAVSSKANDSNVVHKMWEENIQDAKYFWPSESESDGFSCVVLNNTGLPGTVYVQAPEEDGDEGSAQALTIGSRNLTLTKSSSTDPKVINIPEEDGTIALVGESLIFAGTIDAGWSGSVQKIILSDVMKKKMGIDDEYLNINLTALGSEFDGTYAVVKISSSTDHLTDTNGRTYFTGDILLLSSTSNDIKRIKNLTSADYVPAYVPLIYTGEDPPSNSSIRYGTGTIWVNYWTTGTPARCYILTQRSGGGNDGYTYTWSPIPAFTTHTITLNSSDWSNNEQTVSVHGITSTSDVSIDIAPSSIEDAMETPVYCSAQGDGTLTFKCVSTPSVDIVVQIEVRT